MSYEIQLVAGPDHASQLKDTLYLLLPPSLIIHEASNAFVRFGPCDNTEEDLADTTPFHLQPLTAENYFKQPNEMELVLRGKVFWDYVTGDIPEEAPNYTRNRTPAFTHILIKTSPSCKFGLMTL